MWKKNAGKASPQERQFRLCPARHLFLLLALAAVVSASAAFGQEGAPKPLSWLRADGPRIVNEKNETVVLSGINLGGWLVEEMWQMPFATQPPDGSALPPLKDHVSLWTVVETRYGAERMREARTALRNNWLNADDFRRIRDAGMNCVRLPFTYDLLEETGGGFDWLDRGINWARQNGLYVILDLHGAPGRQSADHHTGETGVNRFFADPERIRQTEMLWATIARRYKDRPEVAGYDLLNEPMGAPDPVTLQLVHDRLYRAIRAVDSRHLVFIEDGYKGSDTFPQPSIVGWQNVVLSWHHYRFNARSQQEQIDGLRSTAATARRLQKSRNAPVLLGEFQIEPYSSPEAMAAGLRALQESGVSWTSWSYKAAMNDGRSGMWGWVRATKPVKPLDPYRDTFAEFVGKMAQVRSENLEENTDMTRVFRESVRIAPLPPLQEVLATSRERAVMWRFTTDKPAAENWFAPGFDDSGWKHGEAGFGADWDGEGKARTEWTTRDIYLRREFVVPANGFTNLRLIVCHDDDAEVYLNGVLAAKLPGYTHSYVEAEISPEALASLKPGRNIIAVHCYQGAGNQYIDAGLLGLTGK